MGETMINKIRGRIEESIQVKQQLLTRCLSDIEKAAVVLVQAYKTGHQAVFFGNGGSASDAMHMTAELVGSYLKRRRALPAIALNANVPTLTALANDYSYDEVFSHQMDAYIHPGDVAVGLSTSGRSTNVLKGLEAAKRLGAKTIGLLGKDGGSIAPLVDVAIIVPSSATDRIQESHILVGHILCEMVESAIFP
jgi:D-sedoheptulose 7-phosphate isomerase